MADTGAEPPISATARQCLLVRQHRTYRLRARRSPLGRRTNPLRGSVLWGGGSPIPSFLGGRGGLEEVCLRHGLGEVLHQWREARLWHIRDQVVEHAALAE